MKKVKIIVQNREDLNSLVLRDGYLYTFSHHVTISNKFMQLHRLIFHVKNDQMYYIFFKKKRFNIVTF
jgi:hypothetical protein